MERGGGGNEGGRARERDESGDVKETGMNAKIDKINVHDKEAESKESIGEQKREKEKKRKQKEQIRSS